MSLTAFDIDLSGAADLIAAIGTVGALIVAIREAFRAERAKRNRTAAQIRALIATTKLARQSVQNELEKARAGRLSFRTLANGMHTVGTIRTGLMLFEGIDLGEAPNPEFVDLVLMGRAMFDTMNRIWAKTAKTDAEMEPAFVEAVDILAEIEDRLEKVGSRV